MICQHFEKYGEGVEWPIEASLEHFDNCLTPEQRLRHFTHARDAANRAINCTMQDHQGAMEFLRRWRPVRKPCTHEYHRRQKRRNRR